MSGFEDRKQAFEKKYSHDQDVAFKINARRNKLLGLWAAEMMGKTGDDTEAFAREVVLSEYEEAGENDVFRKVFGALAAAGVTITENEVRLKMNQLLEEAKQQFMQD